MRYAVIYTGENPMQSNLLQLKNLTLRFPVRSGVLQRTTGFVHAVTDVSLSLNEQETLGIVGESGCGKSTLARTIMRLYTPTRGTIEFLGRDITRLSASHLLPMRKSLQMVFQDPAESLNSRITVARILEEPLIVHKMGDRASRKRAIEETLDAVGLGREVLTHFPHEFSGGQRQRIGIARALMARPKLLICDEPVSALDVSVQSQILNLLVELQTRYQLSLLFISHNLSVVRYMSDRVAIMYLGRIVESAKSEDLFFSPRHPYTRALIASIPIPNPNLAKKNRMRLMGEIPSPITPPPGCAFHTRCPFAQQKCLTQPPTLEVVESTRKHQVACHYPL